VSTTDKALVHKEPSSTRIEKNSDISLGQWYWVKEMKFRGTE